MERNPELLPALDFFFVPVWMLLSLILYLQLSIGFLLTDTVLCTPNLLVSCSFLETASNRSSRPVTNSVLIQ